LYLQIGDSSTGRDGAVGLQICIKTPVYQWEYGRLGQWVEAAYKQAQSAY
jgi:hypothetical protein